MATEPTEKKPAATKKNAATGAKKTTRKETVGSATTEIQQPAAPQKSKQELPAERIALLKETVIPKAPTDKPTPPKFGGAKAIFPICLFSFLLSLAILCLLSILATWPTLESLFHGELLETAPEWAAPAMCFSIPLRIALAVFLIIWAFKIPEQFRKILKTAKNAKIAWKKAIDGKRKFGGNTA